MPDNGIKHLNDINIQLSEKEVKSHVTREFVNNIKKSLICTIYDINKLITALTDQIEKLEKEIEYTNLSENLKKHYEQSRRRK